MADRVDNDWVDIPDEGNWVDVPEDQEQGTLPEQLVGGATKGMMRIGRAALGAPTIAVRQAGLLRQWSWAEDVLREKDPDRQAQLLKGMSESKQAFDKTADALGEAQDWHKQGMQTIIERHPEWKSEPPESFIDLLKNPDKLAVALAESMPVLVAAGVLTAAGQPQIAAALMYTTEGQEAYDQAIADGASEEDAATAYGVYGVVAGALEQMQLEGLMKVAKGSYNALLNRTVQKVAKGGLRTAAYGTIKTAAQESLEEMAQGAWQEITAKMVYNKDVPGGVADFIDRRAQEAYIGGIMGMIPGVAGGVVGRVQAGRIAAVTEPEADLTAEDTLIEQRRQQEAKAVEGINVYRTIDGKKTGLTEADLVIKDDVQVEAATGKPVEIDPEAARGAVTQAPGAPGVAEKVAKKPQILYHGSSEGKIELDPKKRFISLTTDRAIAERFAGHDPSKVHRVSINNLRILVEGTPEYAAFLEAVDPKVELPTSKMWTKENLLRHGYDAVADNKGQGEIRVYNTNKITSIEAPPKPAASEVVETPPTPAVEPTPKPPRLTRRKALKLGHSLPKKLGWDEAQRRDFMQETVGKSSMKGMKPAEMRTLVAAMQEQARDQGLLSPENYPKTLFIGAREVETGVFIDESVATVDALKDRAPKQLKMRPRKQAKPRRGVLRTVKAALTGVDNLSIPHLMRQVGAATEGVFKEVGVTNWRRSQHHISAVFRGGVDMLNDALAKAGVSHTDLAKMSAAADPRLELIKRGREVVGKPKTKYHMVEINGKDFSLSMDELMDMYLASLQDMGPGHIESGGFDIRGYKTGPIDEAGMDKLRAIVEADEGAMAAMNAAISIADEYNAPQLNYTNGRLNPETMEDIADKKNYWHLEPKQARKIKGKQTYNISLLENKNILKPRTGGKQPLVIRGFFPRFFSVQYAVAEYVGMAEELRLMNMILNNDQVIESLEAKGYTDVRNNLKQLLEWVQSKGSTTTSTDKLLGKILHGAYRAVLHYSPEVILSQYMSTGHYAGVVPPKYTKLLTVPPTPKLVKEMLKHNPVVWNRYYAGGQSAELAELGKLDVTLRLLTGKHADLNKTGIAAQQTDLAAFAQGWKIAKAITKDTGVQEDTPEFWDAVNDKAEELWDTQPSWDKWNKSINTSQRGIRRVPFLFRSYFEKSLMMLHSANATYEASSKTAADRAKQAQVYGSVVGSQMATALIRTFIGHALWRKRKSVWDYLAAMAGAPFGMVAIVGGYMNRVVGNLIKILAGEKQRFEGEPLSSLPGQTVEDFLIGLNQMTDAAGYYLAGDEDKAMKQTKQGTRKLIISTGTMVGVPARQIDKIIKILESEKTTKYGGGYIL